MTLDGKAVFLITAKLNKGVTLAEGKVLAYGNNAMFRTRIVTVVPMPIWSFPISPWQR